MLIHLCRVPDILIVAHLPQRVKDKRNNLRPAIHNFHARPARQPGEYQVVGRIAQAQDALSLHPAVQTDGDPGALVRIETRQNVRAGGAQQLGFQRVAFERKQRMPRIFPRINRTGKADGGVKPLRDPIAVPAPLGLVIPDGSGFWRRYPSSQAKSLMLSPPPLLPPL